MQGHAEPARQVRLRAALAQRHPVGPRFQERREVLALQILDEHDLELLAVREVMDDDGHLPEAGQGGGGAPAVAGDDAHVLTARGGQERREHALLADRGSQLEQRVRVELAARVQGVRVDARERPHLDALGRRGRSGLCGRRGRDGRLASLLLSRHDSLLSPLPAPG